MKVHLKPPSSQQPRAAVANASEIDVELRRWPVSVGRGWHADLCLDECHVSRRHCELEWVEDAVVVRDMRSKNGTYVNGVRISETILKPGDKLTVGAISFIVAY